MLKSVLLSYSQPHKRIYPQNDMKQDRFLIVILAAICLLVILAVGLFFIRQDTDTYGAEDTPEGVVRNFIIAIHNEDYARAHGYLQDSAKKPDYQEFSKPFLTTRLDPSNISVRISDTRISGDETVVKLILTHTSTNPFQGSWSENGSAVLVQQDGDWKITDMPYPYWDWDWYQ